MNNKAELTKQLIILSIILVLVILIAIALNIDKNDAMTNINASSEQQSDTQNTENNNLTDEQKILNNLKGLLEEPDDEEDYIQDETQGTKENKIITESGETVIIKE